MAKKILIDPGHFAKYNRSPVVREYYEGDRMWSYAQYLIAELKTYGFIVDCTKDSINDYPKTADGDDNIYARGTMAKGYDLLISTHSNACGTESVDRVSVIYPISQKGRDLAVKIGASVSSVMGVSAYKTYSKVNSKGNADYYGVIRGAASVGVPALIVEHSFHTNTRAAKWLMVDANLKKMAEAEAKAIAEYYGVSKPTPTVKPTTTTSELYRVRKSWADSKSQIGAYKNLDNAKEAADKNAGYKVYDKTGKLVYPIQAKSYKVKVTASVLNVRKGAGTSYAVATTVRKGDVYTIVEEKNGFGKLKSGAGWISLAYTKKL